VRSRREELGNTCGVETSLGETKGGSQTCTTSANDKGIIFVVDDRVFIRDEGRCLLGAKRLVGDDLGSRGGAREETSLLSLDASRELSRSKVSDKIRRVRIAESKLKGADASWAEARPATNGATYSRGGGEMPDTKAAHCDDRCDCRGLSRFTRMRA